MSVFDPRYPYVWLLYLLAGLGVAAVIIPLIINAAPAVLRDALKAQPHAQFLLQLLIMAFWPLIFVVLVGAFLADLVTALRRK